MTPQPVAAGRRALRERVRRALLALALASLVPAAVAAAGEGRVLQVPTRDSITTTLFWAPADRARATLLLFPGGGGGFGRIEGGRATGNNFLVRSAPLLVERGFNVAIFGRPGDRAELDYADRVGEAHLADVQRVLEQVRQLSPAPVWLVGTSRGSISATAAAIRLQDRVTGLVLTSSVVSPRRTGAVPTQDLAALRLPVLVLHHERDACPICAPQDVPAILRGLVNAPVKQQIFVSGGAPPQGDPCAALHWHGYIGQEREVVDTIAAWIGEKTPR